jgi:glycosidase
MARERQGRYISRPVRLPPSAHSPISLSRTVSMSRVLAAFLWVVTLVASGCAAPAGVGPPGVPSGAASWVERSALYEVFVRDFSPEGDFRGLIRGLDRIEAVGTDVVWLMPIHPIGELERKGTLGSPYSVADYRGINPDFGDEADFRALVDAVHVRGMKLILDWVPNHTAWDHPWVTDHPDRYTRNAAGEMTHPRDEDGNLTDWVDVVELDFSNPETRRAMIAEMRYWLEEFGVDGFRVDVAGMVPDDFWREAIPQLRSSGATFLLAEWGDPRMHGLGFDLTYPWESYHRVKAVWRGESAARFIEAEAEELRGMPPGAMRLRFTTNHDETAWDEPPVVLFGGSAGARAAFVATALLPGRPLIYNGQEVESPQKLALFEKDTIQWNRAGAEDARAFYRRVVDLSRSHDAFVSGSFDPVEVSVPDDVVAFRRDAVLVLVNARDRPVRVEVPGVRLDGARDLLGGAAPVGNGVDLEAYGAVVLETAP